MQARVVPQMLLRLLRRHAAARHSSRRTGIHWLRCPRTGLRLAARGRAARSGWSTTRGRRWRCGILRGACASRRRVRTWTIRAL